MVILMVLMMVMAVSLMVAMVTSMGSPFASSLANLPVFAKQHPRNTLRCIGWVVIYNCGWEHQLYSNDPQSAPATR